jgi:hypothetical protein
MKKLGLVLIALLVFTTINAQKMWKNEVDDFTGKTIKVTNFRVFVVGHFLRIK